MKWTKEAPKVPGWYWRRVIYTDGRRGIPDVAPHNVFADESASLNGRDFFFPGASHAEYALIAPPEEAGE